MWCPMINRLKHLIDKLAVHHSLEKSEYKLLIANCSDELASYAASKSVKLRQSIYGTDVYIRGLIEISNICHNDCYYCGIRKSNSACSRYRLPHDTIIECCRRGYALGFRTFVLQGGEDSFFTADKVCSIIEHIKNLFPDCAVTLSLGEYSKTDYQSMYNAGADRYLLRHETADKSHYKRLHPASMSFENRMECLTNLKDIGFQTGCGFMAGSPYQSDDNLAQDLKFIETFSPQMCGIGPFIPHKDTPFGNFDAGNAQLTLYLLSLIRLIKPDILLPATTALSTIDDNGREKGILAGANVIMPNLSPVSERKKYMLYNNKICMDEESAENIESLKNKIASIGYRIVTDCGDIKNSNDKLTLTERKEIL